ncbi:hypothetical protein OTK49_01215 [Vibrio coralliirubri]|uniref:hypothetical protein n=1 Tax=Vibrio coralliirubri TaxID=1516159 RepID=UPI002284AF17|nr:hypothetical protein [Vibrio coralliirubri]MCY9861149.1 hypothetical protein [Vibrio coralliirubri]
MNPTNHIASVVEVVAPQKQSIQQIQEQKEFSNKYWMEEHPAFKPINRLHPDGRIINSIDKNGNPIGTSVSPFIQEFDTQVEADIAPVVMALKDKGYFTVSSCGGHPMRSLVTLCFPSTDSREMFVQLVKRMHLPTANFDETDFFFNTDGEFDKYGKHYIEMNEEVDRSLRYYRKTEADLLNLMFLRSYDEYVFLTITLFDEWKYYLNPIKAFQTKRSMPHKAEIIAKFAQSILSEDFPQSKD